MHGLAKFKFIELFLQFQNLSVEVMYDLWLNHKQAALIPIK
jgi:hypothetical protein